VPHSHLLLLFVCLPLLRGAQNASLGGIAVNSVDQKPLAKVNIRLVSTTQAYGAMSDAGGRFSITDILPGAYQVVPERGGFFPARALSLGSILKLRPGDNITDYTVEMTPQAVISGRVLDEYGDPLPSAGVLAESLGADPAHRYPTLALVAALGRPTRVATNYRGEFRIAVPPGSYHIAAHLQEQQIKEIRTDGTSVPTYAYTYYPAALTKTQATTIEAKPGEEVRGIEIRLARQQLFSISGVVSGFPAGSNPLPTLFMMGPGHGEAVSVDPEGRFVKADLVAGQYRLTAQYSDGKISSRGERSIALSTADIRDVVLPLSELGSIEGRIEIKGGQPLDCGTVHLRPTDPADHLMMAMTRDEISAPIGPDGKFLFNSVLPVAYILRIESLAVNSYLESILLNGVEQPYVNQFRVPANPRSSTLRIIVNPNGGQISGTIVHKDGSQAHGHPTLSPLDPSKEVHHAFETTTIIIGDEDTSPLPPPPPFPPPPPPESALQV